jgi:hypothetical protein
MPWTIERRHDHVAVLTMNTNKVNAQNPAFFDDLHAAFDRLEAEFNDCAVVLTGTGAAFWVGLDFDHHFPLFARQSLKEIEAWFDAYHATKLRLFIYPRPTVAGDQWSCIRPRSDHAARLRSSHRFGRRSLRRTRLCLGMECNATSHFIRHTERRKLHA